MTDYHHDHVVVYGELAGTLRLATSARAFVTDTVSGAAVNVTQGTRTAAYVDTDSNGRATFTATTPNRLRLTNGATFLDVWPIEVVGPSDAQVAGYLGTASASQTAADARYVQRTAVQDIAHGGTGQTTAPAALVALGGAPLSLTGTYASRPAATAVAAGTIYYATDVPEQYRSNGTAWSVIGSGGSELGYGEIATAFTTTSTTYVDVTGLTTTFVAGERPILLRFSGLLYKNTTGDANVARLALLIGSTVYKTVWSSNTGFTTFEASARVTGLTPGSTYVAKAQLEVIGTGSATTGSASSGAQSYIQAVTL